MDFVVKIYFMKPLIFFHILSIIVLSLCPNYLTKNTSFLLIYRFSLTEDGMALAEKLLVVDTEISGEVPKISACDETRHQHVFISKKLKTNVKRTGNSAVVIPSSMTPKVSSLTYEIILFELLASVTSL